MSSDPKHDFWLALARSPFLMVRLNDGNEHALPMTAQIDADLGPARGGDIWFFTQPQNRLARGGPAMAQFVSKGHDLFACLAGTNRREEDEAGVGPFSAHAGCARCRHAPPRPALLMLRMDLSDIEIWETDIGIKGLFKMLTGSKVRPGETGSHVHEAV